MNRIDKTFATLKAIQRTALIPYLTLADPDYATSIAMAKVLLEAGADVLELGVPFSDPVADGPVIQRAAERALKAGFKVQQLFTAVAELRQVTDIPIVALTYFNPVLQRGVAAFFAEAQRVGLDGLVIPDLSLEESRAYLSLADQYGVAIIPFLTPTTSPQRAREVGHVGRGFAYCVSLTGVTGAREVASSRADQVIALGRDYTQLPLCVGFGIGSPEVAKKMGAIADGVIVGSAIVRISEQSTQETRATNLFSFVKSLKDALSD